MDIQSKLKFMGLYRMVLADGIVHPAEILRLKTIGRNQYGLTDEVMNKLIVENIADMPKLESSEDKIRLLYEMALIAWADNDLDESERKLLVEYAQYFGISQESIKSLIDYILDNAQKNIPTDDFIKQFNY